MSEVTDLIKAAYGKPLAVTPSGMFEKYSEDQPRDERGRWTSGGGAEPEVGTDAWVQHVKRRDVPFNESLPRHLQGLPRWSNKDVLDALNGKSGIFYHSERLHVEAEAKKRGFKFTSKV
jgi:hypothetical protein